MLTNQDNGFFVLMENFLYLLYIIINYRNINTELM